MNAENLSPDMRLRLAQAFEMLAALLDEETDLVSTARTDGLELYFNTKRRLFEQLGILLREASRAPPLPVFAPDPAAPVLAPAGDAREEAADTDPAPPERVRLAAARLCAATRANTIALQAAQEAVTAVARRLGRVAERQRADGVYGRTGTAGPRAIPGYGRIDHNL
ncbi:hypothetical protein [Niveispirillum fermenti]|uniref:hypothetical protein n=1 Tax=Niveispirillum fermenti TaxID=1233113 RepID=UPI003A87AFBB